MTIFQKKLWAMLSVALAGVVLTIPFVVPHALADCGSDPAVPEQIDPGDVHMVCYKLVNTDACCELNNCGLPPGEQCGGDDCISCPHSFQTEPATKAVESVTGQVNRLQFGFSRCRVRLSDCVFDEDEWCGYTCDPWDEYVICGTYLNSTPEGDFCDGSGGTEPGT